MATDLKLNGGIEAGGDLTLGGAIAATGNVVGNVVSAMGNVQGANGVFSNAISGATGSFSSSVGTLLAKITPEGGYAVNTLDITHGADYVSDNVAGCGNSATEGKIASGLDSAIQF